LPRLCIAPCVYARRDERLKASAWLVWWRRTLRRIPCADRAVKGRKGAGSALADGHDALCAGLAAVVLGVRRDDHRRGADHHDDHLKPDRHTLTCPKAHPDTPSDTRLKTGYLSSINTGGTSKSLSPLRLNPNQCDEKGRRQVVPPLRRVAGLSAASSVTLSSLCTGTSGRVPHAREHAQHFEQEVGCDQRCRSERIIRRGNFH